MIRVQVVVSAFEYCALSATQANPNVEPGPMTAKAWRDTKTKYSAPKVGVGVEV